MPQTLWLSNATNSKLSEVQALKTYESDKTQLVRDGLNLLIHDLMRKRAGLSDDWKTATQFEVPDTYVSQINSLDEIGYLHDAWHVQYQRYFVRDERVVLIARLVIEDPGNELLKQMLDEGYLTAITPDAPFFTVNTHKDWDELEDIARLDTEANNEGGDTGDDS